MDRIPNTVAKGMETLYARFHRRELVHPDPLEFLYRYPEPADREVVGMVAATLAYGRVRQILASVERALAPLGESPAGYLAHASAVGLRRTYADFKHRFTTGAELANLLIGIRHANKHYGSLLDCFKQRLSPHDETVLPALAEFVFQLAEPTEQGCGSLLSSPVNGSACKRLNLFLRWMVRHDAIDPGGWEEVGAHRLIIPLDTHIYRICKLLRFTVRGQANMRTAIEITDAFRTFVPQDPTRYDFAISRVGIRGDMVITELLRICGAEDGDRVTEKRRLP